MWDAWLGFVSSEGASQGLWWNGMGLTSSLCRRREWAKDGTSGGIKVEGRSRVPVNDKGVLLLVTQRDEGGGGPLQGPVKGDFSLLK